MFNKSIAYRLSIYISLAVISVFIAFIGINFLFNLKTIKENVQAKAITESSQITSNVNRQIISVREITSNISEQIIFYDQHNYVQPFIEKIIDKYNFINAIHINIEETVPGLDYRNFYSFKHNDSIHFYKANEPLETCLSSSESFKKLLDKGVKGWSEPIMCKRNMNVVVSYYSPILVQINGEDKQVGEVICELSLLELSKTINNIKIGNNGFAFLVSRNGTYITHPVKEWILTRNIFDLSADVFDINAINVKQALREGKPGTVVARPEILNYQKCWVYYAPISENGWTLLFVLPYKELYEPLYLPILKMLFFSVLGILIIYVLITYITNKQIEPLSTVTNELKEFSTVAGLTEVKGDSSNEIKRVSDSLNEMRIWYEKYKMRASDDAQKSKLQKEDLLQASEIQKSLIKVDFPAFTDRSEIDLYASYKPLKVVSGDLFDYFFQDEDNLVFTMGDVSGKGVPAAFFMSVAQTIIKTYAVEDSSAKAIVTKANEELFTNNMHQFFLTLFLGILNVKTGILTYCNAAHNTTYILREDGTLDKLTDTHGLPLGLYRDKLYRDGTYLLEKGDTIILYTDGVTELQDENKLQFGHERFMKNLKSLKGLEPKEIVEKIEKSLDLFSGDSPRNDDVSILVLKYNG